MGDTDELIEEMGDSKDLFLASSKSTRTPLAGIRKGIPEGDWSGEQFGDFRKDGADGMFFVRSV